MGHLATGDVVSIVGSCVASKASTQRIMDLIEEAGVRSHVAVVGFDEIPAIVDLYHSLSSKGI